MIRLEDGATTLDLSDVDNGAHVDTIVLGPAPPRPVVESRTGADGVRDTTSLHGAGVVTLSGTIKETGVLSRTNVLDSLLRFCRLSSRPYLYFAEEGEPERRVLLRADARSVPFRRPGSALFSLSWAAPDGIAEAATASSMTVAATPDIVAGRMYDLTYDRSYPDSPGIGVVTVTNDGTANAWPVVELHGPCVGPQIENQTTGQRMLFPGLVLLSGEFLELDMRARTARLGGAANQSRLEWLDFAESEWFPLVPGANDLRFYPETDNGGAEAVIDWRDAWLM